MNEQRAQPTGQDLQDWIRLTKTGASAQRLNRLLEHFGSPTALFAATAAEAAAVGRSSLAVAERLLEAHHKATEREIELMAQLDVRLLPRTSPDYPALLREIADPPPALYVRGELPPADAPCVAIVGSRRATDYGKRIAQQFAEALAEAGVIVVSGLAHGVDTAAHRGALQGGGRTLACLGSGVDVVYPYENRELSEAIVENGALLSEYPMLSPPDAWHFPSRNRVVSGVSLGVVVVEAPRGSGALITAACAVDQNREVFAVPGRIDNFRNSGPHALIRDGARLVESVLDILIELRLAPAQSQLALSLDAAAPLPELSAEEARLYALLNEEPQPVDDLIQESGLAAAQVNSSLLMLELKGVARRLPGNTFMRTR